MSKRPKDGPFGRWLHYINKFDTQHLLNQAKHYRHQRPRLMTATPFMKK